MKGLRRPALFIGFELGVGLAAAALAWLFFDDLRFFAWDMGARAWGRAALWGLPLVLLAVLVTSRAVVSRVPFLRRIHEDLSGGPIGDFIREYGWGVLLALSVVAGLSEELLFRGVLQAKIGLWLSALLFGVLHALSWAYFVMAALLGLYFGWVYEATGRNLFVAALLHAAYDFLALLLFKRNFGAGA